MTIRPLPPGTLILALLGVLASPAVALAEERDTAGSGPTAAESANLGLRIGLGPIILVPLDSGPLGGGLSLEGRYRVKAGPVIIGPGARADGYLISGRAIGIVMPALRLTLPLGPLAPFIAGGAGWGWLSSPADDGLALLGGGGLMIHFGRVLALGAEVTYQTIRGTGFETWGFGPVIQF